MARAFAAPAFVHIYDGAGPGEVSARDLADFLRREVRRCDIDVRTDFMAYWLKRDGRRQNAARCVAKRVAQARIRQPHERVCSREPLRGEIDFELRFLTAGKPRPIGLMYDASRLMHIYAERLEPEPPPEHCHLVVTNQLFATWDEPNRRYHARVSLYGFPSLMSTTGLVEAPAKPREYYLARGLGVDGDSMGDVLKGRYLEPRDPRLHEAMKGSVLQAFFYHVTGEPFCESKLCRLFNAHWQVDLIQAQTALGAGLCERHRQMMESLLCM